MQTARAGEKIRGPLCSREIQREKQIKAQNLALQAEGDVLNWQKYWSQVSSI